MPLGLNSFRTICLQFLLGLCFLLYSHVVVLANDDSESAKDVSNSSSSSPYSTPYYHPSTTHWVFWYYGPDNRTYCGNWCITTFSVVGLLLALLFGYCIIKTCLPRRREKKFQKMEENESNEQKNASTQSYYSNMNQPQYNYQPPDVFQQSAPLPTHGNLPPGTLGTSPGHPIDTSHDRTHDIDVPTVQLPVPMLSRGEETQELYENYQSDPSTTVSTPITSTPASPEPTHDDRWFPNKEDFLAHTPQEDFDLIPPICDVLPSRLLTDIIDKLGGSRAWQFVPGQGERTATVANSGRVLFFHQNFKTSVQTNYPLFVLNGEKERALHYFEITVISNLQPGRTNIAIGLGTKPYPDDRLPGTDPHSFAYNSITGQKFNNTFGAREYGPSWGQIGDTIGCGYHPDKAEIFFTKNSEYLGVAFTNNDDYEDVEKRIWFPTIGADGPCQIAVNFGEDKFRYKKARGWSVCGKTL